MKKDARFPKDSTKRIEERRIDNQLKALAKDSQITPPEGYEERLEQILYASSGKRKGGYVKKWCVAAATLVVVLLTGVSVRGTIHYLHSRMNELSDTEVTEYNQTVQEALTETDCYTREFTQKEQKRLTRLKEEYLTEGRYPKKELKVVSDMHSVPKDKLCYVEESSTYYLPERELSEEELLELVDFKYKRDYSVEKLNEDDREVGTEVQTDSAAVEQMAGEAVKAVLDIDVTGLYCVTQLSPSQTLYTMEYKKDNKLICYAVVERETNRVTAVEEMLSTSEEHKTEVKESVLQKGAQEMADTLSAEVWDCPQIVRVSAKYYLDEDLKSVYKESIRYIFELSDGTIYVGSYSLNLKRLTSLNYYKENNENQYTIQEHLQKKYGLTEKNEELTNEILRKYDSMK